MRSAAIHPAIVAALAAAALFGASTPLAKQLVGDVPALWLAGLLYLGSGIGLTVVRALRDRGWQSPQISSGEWPWLGGAILFGGVIAPVLLMIGLSRSSAAAASLLLNLEAVLTAILAWIAFRESTDARIVSGMLLIIAGGVALSWPSRAGTSQEWLGPVAIAGACLCWAIDNNLTRRISASDAVFVAGIKGLVAGVVNAVLATLLLAPVPAAATLGLAMLLGFFGYGLSLTLFVLSLRGLGTARTGAYFSTAPFIGAGIAIIFFGEATTPLFWVAAALMAAGVWIHLTERHEHDHQHEAIEHTHVHEHDAHHQHPHDFAWEDGSSHSHLHRHKPLTHRHAHFPDIHHGHGHRS